MNIPQQTRMRVCVARLALKFDEAWSVELIKSRFKPHFNKVLAAENITFSYIPHQKWSWLQIGLSIVGEDAEDLVEKMSSVISELSKSDGIDIIDQTTEVIDF